MRRSVDELEKEQRRLMEELERVTGELKSARISETGLELGDLVISATGEKCMIQDFRFCGDKPALVVTRQSDGKEAVLLIGWKPVPSSRV